MYSRRHHHKVVLVCSVGTRLINLVRILIKESRVDTRLDPL
jgi:hypothetical protein